MNCPVCKHVLSQIEAGGLTVDACSGGCGGIWFDNFELRKVDEPKEAAGEALLDIPRNPDIKVDHQTRRSCPKCKSMIMMRHLFSPKDKVEVDECPQCAGIWLDAGELSAIRTKFKSEADRKQAADSFLSELCDKQLAAMHKESEAKQASAKRIASALRFVCPSYWMPGKQDWGGY